MILLLFCLHRRDRNASEGYSREVGLLWFCKRSSLKRRRNCGIDKVRYLLVTHANIVIVSCCTVKQTPSSAETLNRGAEDIEIKAL